MSLLAVVRQRDEQFLEQIPIPEDNLIHIHLNRRFPVSRSSPHSFQLAQPLNRSARATEPPWSGFLRRCGTFGKAAPELIDSSPIYATQLHSNLFAFLNSNHHSPLICLSDDPSPNFYLSPHQSTTMADQVQEMLDVPREFLKDGVQFINRAQKRMSLPRAQ